MNKIKKSSDLYYKDGSSDKVYHLQMVEKENNKFDINFQYGKRGGTLKADTKISDANFDEADKLFNKLLKEKLSKGYKPGQEGQTYNQISTNDERQTEILPQLLNQIDENQIDDYINDDNFIFQEKFDGQRRLFEKKEDKIIGINKKGLSVSTLNELDIIFNTTKDFCIDGELIGDKYYLFDILSYNSKDLKDLEYKQRLEYLKKDKILSQFLVKTAFTKEEKISLLNEVKQKKGEGVAIKKINSKYVPGRPASFRGASQLKFKFWESATLEVVSKHKSKRSVEVGAYNEENNLVKLGFVTIPANYDVPNIGDIVEVVYLYAFEGGSIYQSKYKGQRDDQNKKDCSLNQLKYKQNNSDEDEDLQEEKNEDAQSNLIVKKIKIRG